MTDTTTDRPQVTPAQLARATKLAAQLLTAQKHSGEPLAIMSAAIGKAITQTSPREPHGQLLLRAMHSPHGQRPPDEAAVLWVAKRGQTPTAAAVAARMTQVEVARKRHQMVQDAVKDVGDDEGLQAAIYVDEAIAGDAEGKGPSWGRLGVHMGWDRDQAAVAIPRLVKLGWLTSSSEERSLRPGPRAHGK